MTINYKPLLKQLIEKDLEKQDLREAGISWGTISKFSKGEYVSLKVLEKVAKTLNCTLDDIVEIEND